MLSRNLRNTRVREPESSDFLQATVGDPATASNVWLLQGGPGWSSARMEGDMVTLYSQLGGTANVYTMDHRGTGRSTRFDCVAAQITTTGSPFGSLIDPSEVVACAEDLHKTYGDLASFSMTTAATDLATFISKYSNGANTTVYGVSYGTMLVERFMHFAPPEVTGIVLDGVGTTSGAPANEFLYLSDWARNFGAVGDAFLALCEEDSECKLRFESKSLNNTLEEMIQKFDSDPSSTCAALMLNATTPGSNDPPSFGLRFLLGTVLKDPYFRSLIPAIVYRLNRCAPKDVDLVDRLITILNDSDNTVSEDDRLSSDLLYYLIVYSEKWESPIPAMSKLEARFKHTKICDVKVFSKLPLYCTITKEQSPSCKELGVSTYDSDGIVYKRDQYWNKTVTIPSQASILLLSGKLDPQTPSKYGEYFFNVLEGDNKELITFEYAPHGILRSTQLVAGDPWSETCGMKLLASYVRSGGNLQLLDKSYVNEMPGFNLTVPLSYRQSYFSTDDVYDGEYISSLTS